jgi:hypothetical protein
MMSSINTLGSQSQKLRRLIQASFLVLIWFGVTTPSFAASRFDGDWSVIIATQGGACSTTTIRYPVAIRNGTVINAGDVSAAVAGRVTPTGTIRVTVQSGGSSANGSGHLNTTSGGGVWRGYGTNGTCEGMWQAERRSYGGGTQAMARRGAQIYGYAPGYGQERRRSPQY